MKFIPSIKDTEVFHLVPNTLAIVEKHALFSLKYESTHDRSAYNLSRTGHYNNDAHTIYPYLHEAATGADTIRII